jgi:peptide/nickel transport system substrate-binding protein
MIDLTPRRDRFGDGEAPEPRSVNDLIQARIDGRISRRGLIRRAAALGIAAPVVGIMLHATSDEVLGAPNQVRLQSDKTVPADAPTKPAGEAQQGGSLTAGTNEEPDTLNPYITQLVTGTDIITGIMDPLLRYDSKQQLQPSLAEGFEISNDGLTYTFKLRQGVKFHNGDAFGPQDVINTWKMIMNPDFGAFSQLGWEKITDITSPDPATVVMKTKEPFAPFIAYVGTEYESPSKELAKGPEKFKQEFGRAPVGTGPMKFVEWQAKQQITVEKFADYWGEKSKLDKITIRILPDDNTQLVQLRTGEIQMAAGAGALGATRVDEALKIEGVSVLEHATLGWSHVDLKQMDHLRQTKVRQALDFATPSQQIIDKLLKGRALPSVADQAPGTWAFNADIKPRPYDLDQAKKLLAEAGLTPGEKGVLQGKVPTKDPNTPDGEVKPLEIDLWGIAGDTAAQQIVQVIAQSWNSIGVKTNPQFQDVSTIWGPEGYQFNQKMTGCLYGWFNSNDPDDLFYWYSSQIPKTPTGTGGNLPAYFHQYGFQAEIDRLTAAGARETDQEKRKQIYFQIQQLLHDEAPVIFIYWGKSFPVVTQKLGGFWPSAFNRMLWNVQDWYLTK